MKTNPPKNISRRKLLRGAALSTGAAIAAATPGVSRAGLIDWWAQLLGLPCEHHDVVIIGSGFGGAISACRLTAAGIAVTLVEQGQRWDQPLAPGATRFSPYIYPDGRSSWLSNFTTMPMGPPLPINKYAGVLQARSLAGKAVMNGAAYGGGSIVYGGVLAQPEQSVFESVFPSAISYQEMLPYYATVAQMLGRSTTPPDVLASPNYQHVRVATTQDQNAGLTSEALSTGYNWDIVRQEIAGTMPPSVIHGEAIYGVNSGAKNSLDHNYLKQAENTGLMTIKTLTQVQSIGQNAAGQFAIVVNQIDVYGNITNVYQITCNKLFLNAGSITTSSLLVKAKAKGTLPLLNNQIGQGWGNNGDVYALRTYLGHTGQWQAGPPSVGINALNNPLTPLFIEHPQLPMGIELGDLLYFGIGITPTRGTFRYVPLTDSVVIDWPSNDAGQAVVNQALMNTMTALNQANGGVTSNLLTYFGAPYKDDICYHPLGGCVMGQACDYYGRVYGYTGLYVNDGSFMPGTSACTNPSFTIAALAERNIAQVIAQDFA